MEIIIIGASALVYLAYILLYRYFGIYEKARMYALHSLVFLYMIALVVLLVISISGDYGNVAITSAVAALTGFGTVILKFFFADLAGLKK